MKLMAPILSFTAEEAWAIFAPGDPSVFIHTYAALPEVAGADALRTRWTSLRSIRSDVLKKLEDARGASLLGGSLQGDVTLKAQGETLALLQSLGEELKYVLITSHAKVEALALTDAAQFEVSVVVASGTKCARCWHVTEDVGTHAHAAEHPTICGRCADNLEGAGEHRQVA